MTDSPQYLTDQQTNILSEGVCPVCGAEVEYLTSGKNTEAWRCTDLICNREYHLEEVLEEEGSDRS